MHVKEIYVIFIHLFDSGILLIIDLNPKTPDQAHSNVIVVEVEVTLPDIVRSQQSRLNGKVGTMTTRKKNR